MIVNGPLLIAYLPALDPDILVLFLSRASKIVGSRYVQSHHWLASCCCMGWLWIQLASMQGALS